MRCSRQEKNSAITTTTRRTPRGVVNGLAALVGLGLCLGLSQASAAQGQAKQAPVSPGPVAGKTRVLRVANKDRSRLITAGVTTIGAFWSVSALAASLSELTKGSTSSRPHQGVFVQRSRLRRHPSDAALMIPLAGPWITVGSHPHSPAAAVGLATLGIGQAVGLGMLIGGLSMSKEVRVYIHKDSVLQMRAAPVVSPGGVGLQLHGAF